MGRAGRRLGGPLAVLAAAGTLASCVSVPPDASPDDSPNPAPGAAEPVTPPPAQDTPPIPEDCDTDPELPKRQMRGVWLTTVRNIDWPAESGLSAQRQQEEMRDHLDQAAALSLNTVFLQIRPTADAVYESELEPWARYLTGEQGGDPGYDPLAFAVDEAHERGLELHAWFNPYRVGWQDADLDHLDPDHPVERNPEWLIVKEDEGYLDPGNPDVREWVGDVVLDVVERYDIDGVHFDDYFYPYPGDGEPFDDDASWRAHGGEFERRADWRRENVNTLISEVHERIGDTKPWVRFGISPFGVWRNAETDPSGSDTQALQSYDDIYADTRAWIENGWVDYVVPQLYWHRGFEAADYEELVPWWSEEVAGTAVDLYIGQAAYRVGDDEWEEWEADDALARQLDFNTGHPAVRGDVYFSMTSLTGAAGAAMDEVAAHHYRRPALPPRAADGGAAPAPVTDLRAAAEGADGDAGTAARLEWTVPEGARFFAVYRVEAGAEDLCALADAAGLVDVVGAGEEGEAQTYLDPDGADGGEARYYVTALDAYRTESGPGSGADIA